MNYRIEHFFNFILIHFSARKHLHNNVRFINSEFCATAETLGYTGEVAKEWKKLDTEYAENTDLIEWYDKFCECRFSTTLQKEMIRRIKLKKDFIKRNIDAFIKKQSFYDRIHPVVINFTGREYELPD